MTQLRPPQSEAGDTEADTVTVCRVAPALAALERIACLSQPAALTAIDRWMLTLYWVMVRLEETRTLLTALQWLQHAAAYTHHTVHSLMANTLGVSGWECILDHPGCCNSACARERI